VTLSPRPFAVWQGPELAVNAAGDAVAAWTGSHGGDLLEVSTRRAGGSWQPAAELAGGNGRYNGLFWSDVSIDPAGNAIVVWTDDTTAHAAVHPAESSFWQPPVTIGSTSGRIEAAFDGAGNATVAWTSAGTIVATYRPLGGTWNTPLQVGTGNVFRLVAGAESGPILAWYDDGGMLYTTSRTPRGAWPISRISPVSRNFLALDLACDARGNAVAVWSDRRATWGAFRPKGGSWHPSQIATPSSSNESASFPSVSLDGSGAAVAVWASDETLPPYDRKIETSELKPDGPLLDSLTVPARAKAGRRIRMSVRALQWGPRLEGAPRWSFGDGLGSGQRVSHIYRRRGIYTVSVSERDASGRTATATATIRIGSR
jgi:head-tail adaptor